MTKQQLLALLREAYCEGSYDTVRGSLSANSFIAEIEHTNRVGDLELPDFAKMEGPIKAQAVMDAIEECKITTDRYGDICLVDELVSNAYEQGKG